MDQPDFQSAGDAKQWRDWVDYEGGLMGFLHRGGPTVFPPSVRNKAEALNTAYEELFNAVCEELENFGVQW